MMWQAGAAKNFPFNNISCGSRGPILTWSRTAFC
jgi:hypothetical protein